MSSSSSIPFRSKKPLNQIPPKPQNQNLDLKTPEKPPVLPRRNVALSLKQVRKAAERISVPSNQKSSSDGKAQISSARRKIVDFPERQKTKDDSDVAELPERFEILGEFFNNLNNSIRLLKLKGSATNFTNIRPKIESLTDARRFTYTHLAQLKYLLPEVIEIKKTLIFNEKTSCMKPDLHISLNLDALESDKKLKSEDRNSYLRRVFQSRLVDFSRSHPEDLEVPKGELPEPFNNLERGVNSAFIKVPPSSPCEAVDVQLVGEESDKVHEELKSIQSTHLKVNKVSGSALLSKTLSEKPKTQLQAAASHLSCSFQSRFSRRQRSIAVDDLPPKSSEPSAQSSGDLVADSCPKTASSIEEVNIGIDFCPLNATPSKVLSVLEDGTPMKNASIESTPVKPIFNKEEVTPLKNASIESTPVKSDSTPARLMTATPALRPSKRSYMSPEDNSISDKLVRRQPCSKSLNFESPVKNNRAKDEDIDMKGVSIDKNLLDILPENLLHSIREKEIKAMEERDPAITQAKRRRKMIASLPKLFNMIHFLFQSINRSVITKEELMHKIVSSHFDIVDKREVDEQLSLLVELVPDWISEKMGSGGDLLLRINKTTSPESIRSRLEEAK
ncbi:CDT1-like protein a, chloroplastic [Cannabis sativa]|uniref:CDT1-like protein a, chloroplastic n=1 Tax=Cannabis sativa TaxID=3483 RepID=UPI0029CA8BDB|nr:CDT1-like protein a, chloroplastic [Cannabis sativa]